MSSFPGCAARQPVRPVSARSGRKEFIDGASCTPRLRYDDPWVRLKPDSTYGLVDAGLRSRRLAYVESGFSRTVGWAGLCRSAPIGYALTMPTAPFRTLDDVVDGLADLETRFRHLNDRRAVFLTLYGVVSAEIRLQVARQEFEDNEWVRRYAVAFADLYRVALERYDAGDLAAVPKAWRLTFDAARGGSGLVVQDMLLGVNAHVNADLPHALTTVSIGPDRPARYRDHSAVNAVLGAVTERATQRLAALYAPGLIGIDASAGTVDEIISAFSLEVARESAWEAAVALANASSPFERGLVTRLISARSAAVARLLLSPSRNPPLIEACRRLEQGTSWVTIFGDAASIRS